MDIRSCFARKKKPNSFINSPSKTSIKPSSSSMNPKTHIKEFEEVFKKFDDNKDGKISSYELGMIMGSLGHSTLTEEELQNMVGMVDLDGDGLIDLNEFIELNTKGIDSNELLEDLKVAFLMYDSDQNGFISAVELQEVLRSLGEECPIEKCKKMIRGVDRDGDGMVSFEEFKNMMMDTSHSDSY